MNIRQVKERWTLEKLLAQLGYHPDQKKSRAHDLWYCSPFRNETEPSMHVDPEKDIWMDFGLVEEKSGGDLIYFAQVYLGSQGKGNSISEVLGWFSSLSGESTPPITIERPRASSTTKREQFKLLSVKPIFTDALFDYLQERNISREVGGRYLRQVYFQHTETGRKTFGLGMENQKGGYEVRNPLGFKGVVGRKAITTVFGEVSSSRIAVFEGMFDFLSWICMQQEAGKQAGDALIMHTNRLYVPAAEVIKEKGYKAVDLWLDNDAGGDQGKEALEGLLHGGVVIKGCRDKYHEFNDLSQMWSVNI